MRLNEKTIKALEAPATGNRIAYDEEVSGLGLRITAAGSRAFVFAYRTNGRERRMTIGPWPEWTATAARERCKELRRRVDRGEDPLGEKEQLRRDPTFSDLVGAYIEIEASKQKGFREYRRLLERDALPAWKNIRAADLRRRDVIALIEAKAETAPIAANRLFELLRRVYNFGIRRDLVETNPCLLVRKPGQEHSKDRVLTEDEIRSLWRALDGPGFSRETAAAIRLILITAQRPGEVCGLEWADVAGEWWTIPSEKSKNGLAHRVPLSKLATEILDTLPRASRYAFQSGRTARPIQRGALAYALRRARAPQLDGAPLLDVAGFSPHDLRRTAASMMTQAGVERFVVRRILNHVEPGVTKVYDRYSYDAEKQKALSTWDRKLRGILEGKPAEKVVRIR